MRINKNFISAENFRRVISYSLFPAVLVPCGIFFVFVFLCLFWSTGDIITTKILGWIILTMGLLWFMSLLAIIFCLAFAFLLDTEKTITHYQELNNIEPLDSSDN
ncbi:MAG: hypothetical protein LBE18_04905 [Planctomycetaceae bacterium]|jgi:hypothetical protein|nr:hypothetical protein [Planctomycetaceae bacterium]